jgi:hypothetical protein
MVIRALLAIGALLATPALSMGVERVARDTQGRSIQFDVQGPNVNVADYARVVRGAVHGDEIEDVTIVIVPANRVGRRCGSREATGCYGVVNGRGRIVVPAGSGTRMAHTLLHEYGHHLDRTITHGDRREPNGTPRWWAARRMGERLRSGEVAQGYRRGWERSVGEIFAEDYVALNLKTLYGIDWLRPPSTSVLTALRRDLTGRATGPPPAETPPESPRPPVVITREGALAPGETRVEPFGLLGTGRRIQVTGEVTTATGEPSRLRADVECDGVTLSGAEAGDGTPLAIDLPGSGPGRCSLTLTGVAGVADYRVTLTLSVESTGGG